MVTVDRRSDVAAALCYAALTPPGARAALWVKHAGATRPSPLHKKLIRNTPLAVFRAARSDSIFLLVSHVTVAWEMDPKLETLNL